MTSDPSGSCGPYTYSGITNSNGFNTYVSNNCWGDPSCRQTVSANNPGDWRLVSTEPAGNTAVRTYPDVKQLMNNWTGGGWNGPGDMTDTPISGLSSLTSAYSESMPHNNGTIAQAAYDIWTDYSSDIMIWLDNVNRQEGGADLIGHATLGGQAFTVYRFGGPGGEIIFSLDGAGGTGTFAQQSSGTVDLLAALQWVKANVDPGLSAIGEIDFGWEICSTGGVNETFAVSNFALKGTV